MEPATVSGSPRSGGSRIQARRPGRVLAAALLVLAPTLPAGAQGVPSGPHAPDSTLVLVGTVRADGYRADGLLPGAMVEVRQGDRVRVVLVGSGAEYRVSGLRPGYARVLVSHIGAFPLELDVHLPDRGTAHLDLDLERRAIPLRPVYLRTAALLNEPAEPLTLGDRRAAALRLRAMEATTGIAESGLAAALLPGLRGGEPDEPGRALFARGSAVTARTVLLDGAPVLTPFNVAGLVEPFHPDVMGDASLFLAGGPSRLQGGLSYLLDVDTRPPRRDRVRGSVGMDGLEARGFLESPLPAGGGLLLSARGIHGLQERAGGGAAFPYAHHDVLARVSLSPAPGHELRVTGFQNLEGVRLELDPEAFPGRARAEWGNQLLSASWRGRVGDLRLRGAGSFSRYQSVLPVPWEDPMLARGLQDRSRGAADVRIPVGAGALEVGASAERLALRYHLETGPEALRTHFVDEDPGEAALSSVTTALHGEWEGEVDRAVRVRAGLRGEHTSHDGRVRFAPRLGLTMVLGDRALLRVDGGASHQILATPGLRARPGGEAPDTLSWRPGLAVGRATHLVVSLDQELRPDLRTELAGFAREYRGVGPPGERLRSSGLELRLASEGERTAAWMGYTLTWFWAVEGFGGSSRFDGSHLLSAGFRRDLGGGLELGGSLGYGAGLPLSAVAAEANFPEAGAGWPARHVPTLNGAMDRELASPFSSLDGAPADDFLRLDLEVSWRTTPTVGGRSTELRPYLKALNALNRRDAMFYYLDRWRSDDLRPVTERPLLPVLGLEWRF